MTVLVMWQATMAGQHMSGNGLALLLHEAGSSALFAAAVVTTVCAVVAWRRGALAGRLAAVAGIVLPALVTLQAYAGYARWLHLHVPLGVGLLGLTIGVLLLTPSRLEIRAPHRR